MCVGKKYCLLLDTSTSVKRECYIINHLAYDAALFNRLKNTSALPCFNPRPHCQHKSCNKCPLYVDTTEADKAKVITAAKDAAKSVAKKANVDVDSLVKGLSPSKDPPPFTFQVVCPATLPVTRAIQVIHPITKQKINLVVPVGVQPGGIFAVRVTNKAAPAPPQQVVQPPARQQPAQQAQATRRQLAQQAQQRAQQAQQLAQQVQHLAQQNAQNHVKRQRKKG